jgi:hypothetical protein
MMHVCDDMLATGSLATSKRFRLVDQCCCVLGTRRKEGYVPHSRQRVPANEGRQINHLKGTLQLQESWYTYRTV